MLDPRRYIGAALHQDHVEPAGPVRQMALGKILRSQPDQLGLLPPVYGQPRSSERTGRPRFHFDEDKHPAIFGHQIKLSDRRTQVSLQDAIPLFAQKLFGAGFTFLTEQVTGVVCGHSRIH